VKLAAAVLIGLSFSACALLTSRPPEARVHREPRGRIEVRVSEIDDDAGRRPYRQALRYEAELSCRSRFHDGARTFSKRGVSDYGDFALPFPGDCPDEAELSLDVLPDYHRCRPADRDLKRMSVWPGKKVEIEVRCESESYRAKLEALSVLDCHESAAEVEIVAEHEFWVRGCGRSVRMRCLESESDRDLECEHGRVHREDAR
jgi:hypothetical protein